MSFGQKPSAWARPQSTQQQLNPNLFTNQLGLAAGQAAFMQGMPLNSGLAGLVNQAAFTNTMGMPTMNTMLAAQAQRTQQILPQQQVRQQQQPQQNASPTRSQRTFIGVVTKLMETYGFVDEDVFFQTNVIRGSMPRVGDRVMVEASYNPSMPFKWNACRIQLIQDGSSIQQTARQTQQNGTNMGNSRWSDRVIRDEPKRQIPISRRSPAREPPIKRPLPQRSSPSRRSPSRRSPLPRRQEPPPKRERETLESRDRDSAAARVRSPQSSKRDTTSPPRRRQRIMPRYHCTLPKQTLPIGELRCADIRRRYANLYIPSDFIHCGFDWLKSIPLEQPLKFSPYPIVFHVLHKDVDIPTVNDGEEKVPENPDDADYRFVVKILLISHPGLSVLRQKLSGLLPDGSIDESTETQPLFKNIHLLVGHRGKGEYMCIGGPWSPSLDGKNPLDPGTLVNTAVRTTRTLTGLDLSLCAKWYKMAHLRYFRVERQRVDTVILMLPDTSSVPSFHVTDESYRVSEQCLHDQYAAKLSAIDAEEFVPPNQNKEKENNKAEPLGVISSSADEQQHDGVGSIPSAVNVETDNGKEQSELQQKEQTQATEPTQTASLGNSAAPEAVEMDLTTELPHQNEQQLAEQIESDSTFLDNSSSQGSVVKQKKDGKTHWSVLELNIKAMKVAELREELETRNLDSKGVKNVLMQRLQEAIDREKSSEVQGGLTLSEEITGSIVGELSAQQEKNSATEQTQSILVQPAEQQTDIGMTVNEKLIENEIVKEKESIMVQIKEEIIELMETDEAEGETEKKETTDEKIAREKSEKELQDLEKARDKFEKEKKERKATLERHYGQIPKESGILVFPSKTAKSGKFDCKLLSLHSLLDYRTEDSKESSFEVFLFAEALKETIERGNAFLVYHKISTSLEKEIEKKRRNEALAEACKDDEVVILDEGKKDEKEEKSKSPVDLTTNFKQLVHDLDSFSAFTHFDTNICGFLVDRDLEDILFATGLDFSRGDVQRLVKKVSSKDRVTYRNLTDKWVDKDGNVKYVTGLSTDDLIHSMAEHAKGHAIHIYGVNTNQNNEQLQKEQITTENGIVFFNDTLVNIKQCVEQQNIMERERQEIYEKNEHLELQLKTTKEQRDQLEKKKRRLEEDLDRYKKKLHETEKNFKKEQDDSAAMKNTLHDCKRFGERIIGSVEKIFPPPPKKEEKNKEDSGSDVFVLEKMGKEQQKSSPLMAEKVISALEEATKTMLSKDKDVNDKRAKSVI